MTKPSRNAPCPCGSGKKYKQCCLFGKGALPQKKRDDKISSASWAGWEVIEDELDTLSNRIVDLLQQGQIQKARAAREELRERYPEELYKAHSLEGPFAGQGHLHSAVKYLPMLDLRSTNDLQTLPTHNIVAVYDVNGQVSPKIVAYLRLLGYDAKSMLFGANNLFYSSVLWVESLERFAFKQQMIMDLPYVTGN